MEADLDIYHEMAITRIPHILHDFKACFTSQIQGPTPVESGNSQKQRGCVMQSGPLEALSV